MLKWTPIPNFARYEVSDNGRVRIRKNQKEIKIQLPGVKRKYHMVVLVRDDHRRANCYVHRLMFEAFNGPADLVGFKQPGLRNRLVLSNLVSIPAREGDDGMKRPLHSDWRERAMAEDNV